LPERERIKLFPGQPDMFQSMGTGAAIGELIVIFYCFETGVKKSRFFCILIEPKT